MLKKTIMAVGFALPGVLFANSDLSVDYSETVSILTGYSLASAIALGIVTSIVVIINGRRMKGGVLGKALFSLGVGMLIVLVGTIASFFPNLTPDFLQGALPNLLNTLGYVIMAVAATRILGVTQR